MTNSKMNQDDESENNGKLNHSSEMHDSAQKCPHHALSSAAENTGGITMMRISEVLKKYPDDSAMVRIVNWVNEFLARPHPDLGRRGSVCPFVPLSVELDTIWMAEVVDQDLTLEGITSIIMNYRELFLKTEPTSGSDAMNKAFLVVFPKLGDDGAQFVDKVQFQLKKHFVDMGLMLGEFHANNESPGLRNDNFRPLRSPIPMLAIRHMVDSDLPFLLKDIYPVGDRAAFLRSYLIRLGNNLSPAKFGQALESVIDAEIQKWIAKAQTGDLLLQPSKESESNEDSKSVNS